MHDPWGKAPEYGLCKSCSSEQDDVSELPWCHTKQLLQGAGKGLSHWDLRRGMPWRREQRRWRRDVVSQQKTSVKCRAAGRPTTAPVPALCCGTHLILGEFRKNFSSAAAWALLHNLAAVWTRGGLLLLLRGKSECKKAQRNTKVVLKGVLQDLRHLTELRPLSMTNLLHPLDFPASRS